MKRSTVLLLTCLAACDSHPGSGPSTLGPQADAGRDARDQASPSEDSSGPSGGSYDSGGDELHDATVEATDSAGDDGSSGLFDGTSGLFDGTSGLLDGTSIVFDANGETGIPLPCKLPGLWCYQTTGACQTTLSGTVYDPAGKNPLYNVVVYIPSDPAKPLPTITPGTSSCAPCDMRIGDYLAVSVTDSKGHFQLDNVPATTHVPIVVQTGKWRRQMYISNINRCTNNQVPDVTPDQRLRLPRNRQEGDMPQMALLTGGLDDMGCFMRGVGIDANEFSAPQGGGRLDIYQGVGGAVLTGGQAGQCSTGTTCPLWQSKQSLEYYDMAFLACEGAEHQETKPAASMTALHDWLNEGGKVFATHFHYIWFSAGPPDFQGLGTWLGASAGVGTGNYTLDVSFPKGQSFRDWLTNVGAANGTTIPLQNVATSLNTIGPNATRWIYDPLSVTSYGLDGGLTTFMHQNDVKYMTFLTPIGGVPGSADAGVGDGGGGVMTTRQYCGKGVFTDLHTSGMPAPGEDVPGQCSGADLTPQQKALEFLLFDLSACVEPENRPPTPPPPPPM